jgi:hypothetical protein
MEGLSRLVCIAIASKHHVEHSAAVEANCQQCVIAVLAVGVVADERERDNRMTKSGRQADTRQRSTGHID